MSKWELYDIIMRHFLYYLKTNKWHRCQKDIKIAKEIDIRTARIVLKESKKADKYSLASQADTAARRAAIAKQKTEGCEKISKKVFNRFVIETWLDSIDNIIFSYK